MRSHTYVRLSHLFAIAVLLVLGGSLALSAESAAELRCGRLDAAVTVVHSATHVLASARWSDASPSFARRSARYHVALASEGGALWRAFADAASGCLRDAHSQPDLTDWHEVATAGADRALLALNAELRAPVSGFLVVKAVDRAGRSVVFRGPSTRFDPPATAAADSDARSLDARDSLSDACDCRPSAASILNALYGPVRLPINYANENGGAGSNGGSEDDGYSAITKAGIVIATVVGPTILFALLLLLLCGGASAASFSGGGVVATEFPGGVRGNLGMENQATTVERSFPSTALDLNQKIEAPAEAAAVQSGRTNLSTALQAKTPSDRDYRTALG